MGISQSYGHLLIISATLRACVASTGFVLILVEKPFAHAFQDLQVLTRGNAVQAVKGISLQKVAKDGSINYTMEPISNIEWEFNNSFSILPLLTKEGCRVACLED